MRLSPADNAFVEKRERRVKHWPWVGSLMLAMVVAYGAWLLVKMPHLVNPWYVIESLELGSLSESAKMVMATMLPVVMSALLVFSLVAVLLWFVAFRNERRLIRLVRKLEAELGGGKANG